MLTNENLKEIEEKGKTQGLSVGFSDISYCALLLSFKDYKTAYKAIHGNTATDADIDAYNKSAVVLWTKEKLQEQEDIASSLSNEKSAAQIEANLRELKKHWKEQAMSYKDYMTTDANLRSKVAQLRGKANTEHRQYVEVLTKFNSVCPHCRREIHTISEEELIKKYNLVKLVQNG